jgi:TonB-linked SusC/RagA family outer membrane protein
MNVRNVRFGLALIGFLFCFATSYAQQVQRVTVNLNQASLKDVFNAIEKQTTYRFSYRDVVIDSQTEVSLNKTQAVVSDVLDEALKGRALTYRILSPESIVISEKQQTGTQKGGLRTVTGVVKDATGEPLVGVSILVEGTTDGTVTDLDGNYSLMTTAATPRLKFSYVGYKDQTIAAGSQNTINVTLQDDTQVLGEVVVTALGIKREAKALSYNVQKVSAEDITTVKDANFMNALAGKVAGVQVNTGAGGAGGATRVVMRGMKSITKDNNALYVIDGVPMFNTGSGGGDGAFSDQGGSDAVADLNPDDIESINMMTGPSAAALYGSAAANGVVLINTKKGKKEKVSVSVSNSTTFSSAYVMPKMQNTYGTSSGMFSWGDPTDRRYDPRNFFNTGSNVINSLSLSTGTEKNQTYFSASTTNSKGILPNNSYNRYNFTARNTTSFAQDRLTLDIGAQYIIQNDRNMVSQGEYYNPLPALYLFPRGDDFNEVRLFERYDTALGYMKQSWKYGSESLSLQNPYWIQKRLLRDSSKKRYILNAQLKWKITDWINVVGRVNLDNSDYRNTTKKYASTLTTFAGLNGGYQDEMRQERSLYMDVLATLDKRFGDFSLNVNLGASLYHTSMQSIGYAGDLLIANFFALNNINYQNNYKPLQEGWDDETQSIFANAEIGWKSMLYLTLTGRNDWDSKLAFSNNSSYFYPSVGLSAVLTEMFKLPELISYAKIRGSYTMVASSFDRFMTNPGYTYDTQSHNWARPQTYPNVDLKPEKTKSWEIGLNTKLWKNRFNLDVTYYRSNTTNQTFNVDVPESSGYKNATVQTGNIQNQGVELAFGFQNKWGDFGWRTNLTYTYNQNKVKRLATGAINPVTGEAIQMDEMPVGWLGAENVAPRVILREGGSLTDIYVYNQLKTDNNGNIFIDAQTGNPAMESSSKPTKVGSLNPNHSLGWNNELSYKGLTLGFTVSARIGGLAYSATQGVLDYYGASKATADARDRGGVWVNNGYADAAKYYQTIGTAKGGYGRYYLYDASTVRLQELSLNYTLPKKWLKNVAAITVGFVGRNLWMIYCKAPFDPELSASTASNYYMNVDYFMQPSTRNLGFNVKVQF